MLLFLPIFAYLCGSIPFGRLFGRWIGIDITRVGSGNIGATNVRRVGGNFWGFLTLFADIFKGALPAGWMLWFVHRHELLNSPVFSVILISLTGLLAILGHMFPVYTGFRNGGKGVATTAGVFGILCPWGALWALGAFLLGVGLSRKASVGSLSAAALLPIATGYYDFPLLPAAILSSVLIIYKHAANIERLLSGKEPSV
ncbi:glycerol-3-phosphate 1-O-acyltransferase PlsY [Desulfatirhabdium butyrativorans]|uniref:glycerol-3-phosphate 1-O-acyltransferase PlsY n=1 Tax=Desulfatirhabdium butyrativorans TaxID=340467 RepID=UPI0003F53379|nr:glycerol-3-phosphate 1-O-acyltransferase PlsY [Desulfatirhabdium butyrativorans]